MRLHHSISSANAFYTNTTQKNESLRDCLYLGENNGMCCFKKGAGSLNLANNNKWLRFFFFFEAYLVKRVTSDQHLSKFCFGFMLYCRKSLMIMLLHFTASVAQHK